MRRLRGAVVRLAEIAVDAGRRGREHDPPIVAFPHARPDGLRAIGRADQVHAEDEFEIRHLHFRKGLVAQHAGVVDEDVDAAPVLFGARRHCGDLLEIGDVGGIGHRGPAAGANLLHDAQRIVGRDAVSAEVVDDDFRAARREPKSMRASEAGARAGDDGDSAVKLDCHELSPCRRLAPRALLPGQINLSDAELTTSGAVSPSLSNQAAIRSRFPRPSRERSPKSANRRSAHAESCRAPSKRRYRCRRGSPRGSPRRPSSLKAPNSALRCR